jgi:DNA polymerase I-like protein with 3'-5' exonuclease and polymerase domains
MAKAILEYDLNDPDDTMAHMRAVKSLDMALVLWEMAYNVKKLIQSQAENENLDSYDAIEKVFEKFWEQMEERGIKIDELIV